MDKLKPIDISIVSAHMGRFQTAIVALLVIGITAHALVTRGSARGHVTLLMAVSGAGDQYHLLSRLIAKRTGRCVEVVEGVVDGDSELFVMPSMEFLRRRGELDLVPLLGLSEVAGDRAVIVAAGADARPPKRAGDVLFSSPGSVNGCWIQLHSLFRRQAILPASIDSLPFGGDGRYVAWAVRNGVVSYGACRASDLEGFDPGGVTVVFQTPALPEQIVAARARDEEYFLDCLGGLGAAIDAPQPGERDVVDLLRGHGVGCARPVSRGQMKDLESVFQFHDDMTPSAVSGGAGSP